MQTVKVPSAAPYASRSELLFPNFKTVTEALHWSKMQCIPTKEYAGSTFRTGGSLSLALELKLVL